MIDTTRGLLFKDGRDVEQLERDVRFHCAQQDFLAKALEVPHSVSQAVARALARPTFRGHPLPSTPEREYLAHEIGRVSDRHWLDIENSPAEMEVAARTAGQLQLEFAAKEKRVNARTQIAAFLDRVVLPATDDATVHGIPNRLRRARAHGVVMYRPEDGKKVFLWQEKAGLPLLCPDDARQEAARLKRRVLPKLLELVNSRHAVHYFVGSLDNAPAGRLAVTMDRCQKRVRALTRMVKDGRPRFPAIKGWLATLEAPLGQAHDWNVHVNVLFVTDGSYLDYADLQKAWGAWMHCERVGSRSKQGVCDADALERSLVELIKYPVRTVAEKSDEPDSKAPPMVEWSAAEWLEWWHAHKGFRRTRTGGVLFKLPKPAKESLEGFRALGTIHERGGRYLFVSSLLYSIMGDKSPKEASEKEYRSRCRRVLGPPEIAETMLAESEGIDWAWSHIKNSVDFGD